MLLHLFHNKLFSFKPPTSVKKQSEVEFELSINANNFDIREIGGKVYTCFILF